MLDPAHAPGTGTPEAGGITSRELLEFLRGLVGLNIIGADVVEVAPAYDHAEITGIAASHVAYDLVSLLALQHGSRSLMLPVHRPPPSDTFRACDSAAAASDARKGISRARR